MHMDIKHEYIRMFRNDIIRLKRRAPLLAKQSSTSSVEGVLSICPCNNINESSSSSPILRTQEAVFSTLLKTLALLSLLVVLLAHTGMHED